MERFWGKVEKSDGCWLWTASIVGGYGHFSIDGKRVLAHRVSYALHHGITVDEIEGYVCHACDNPKCVRPDHLFLGDAASNAADRDAKGRGVTFRGSTYPQGESVRRFLDGLKAHMEREEITVSELGKRTGIIRQNISRILNGSTGRITAERADELARAAGFRFTLGEADGEGSEEG